jgi:hypothetical protein
VSIRRREETPIAPNVSTFPYPSGYRILGSRAEKVIVLNVSISERISAAECPASANNDEECNSTPAAALTQTNAKFTNLGLAFSTSVGGYNPIRVIRTPGLVVSFEVRRVVSWT